MTRDSALHPRAHTPPHIEISPSATVRTEGVSALLQKKMQLGGFFSLIQQGSLLKTVKLKQLETIPQITTI